MMNIKRGDLYTAILDGKGNQQNGKRPVLIYSNNKNNINAPTVNILPLSGEIKDLCVHVLIKGFGLRTESIILPEQITTINKTQLVRKIGTIDKKLMEKVDIAVDIQLGRIPFTINMFKNNPFEVA